MEPVTVTQLTNYISRILREDLNLKNIPVRGEISGISTSNRHYYLTLKDSESSIRAAIWASNVPNINPALLKDGTGVVVIGDISPYAKNGTYSLSIRMMKGEGEGDLAAEFNRIKAMLEKEGLFDSIHKKPLPAFPKRVGVITSDTGAAIEDIKRTITKKNAYADIILFPTLVQGESAPAGICKNIELANALNKSGEKKIDVLIVGRGGGSADDLTAFNTEEVARAVFASEIPIISAVGHESDVSICDFVADYRAATPTAAAEAAVPDTYKLMLELQSLGKTLLTALEQKLSYSRELLKTQTELLNAAAKNKLQSARHDMEKMLISLEENNPKNILGKGYSLLSGDEGRIISSVSDVIMGSDYTLSLNDGDIKVRALELLKNTSEHND